MIGNGDLDGMIQNMRGQGGSMVTMSSSFSSNGREVHSSTTSARMGPGGVAEIQSQVIAVALLYRTPWDFLRLMQMPCCLSGGTSYV